MRVDRYELRNHRYEVEQAQRWQDEVARLPWIQFPTDWKVKVIPPYGDAVVRFLVMLPDGREKSVYHDTRSSLGMHFGDGDEPIPYWEVYPVNGDVGRCRTDEVELLLEMIAEGSEEKKETNMDGWITDREPGELYVYNKYGIVTHFSDIKEGDPWMRIPRIDPYVKPKRWGVVYLHDTNEYCVVECNRKPYRSYSVPTREAAERIAEIYEEVMP